MSLERAQVSLPISVEYVCPMHPEIVQSEPGTCPICGMALERRSVTLDEEANPELIDMTRRFWVSLGLTLPIFGWTMTEMFAGNSLTRLLPMPLQSWLQLVLATPVVLWGGWPFFQRGWVSIDGVLSEGASSIDESLVTGEPSRICSSLNCGRASKLLRSICRVVPVA